MNKKTSLQVAFGLLLILGSLTIIPQRSDASTWSANYTTSCPSGQLCFTNAVIEAGSGGVGGDSFFGTSAAGISAVSCTVATTTCAPLQTISTFTASPNAWGFSRNHSVGALCASYTSGNVEFARASNGAWSTAQTVDATTSTTVAACGVDCNTASDCVVAYDDSGGHALTVRHTLSSGASWTNPVTGGIIEANRVDAQAIVNMVSASTWVVSYIVGTTPGVGTQYDLRSCKTTDTGATWACQRIAAAVVSNVHLYRTASGRILGSMMRSNTATFLFSDDNGDSWSTVSVGSEGGMGALSIQETDDNHIFMTWCGTQDQLLHDATALTGGRILSDWTLSSYVLGTALNNFGCGSYGLGFTTTGLAVEMHTSFFSNLGTCSGCGGTTVFTSSIFGATGPATPGATNTVAVTNLIGFDVDNFGNAVIARVGNGNAVKSFVGSSLALLNTVSTPNCNRQDGVAALLAPTTTAGNPTPHNTEFLTYIDCASGGASTKLIITDDHLNPPSQPAFCTDENSGTSTGGNGASGPFCNSVIQNNDCGLFCITDDHIPLPTGLEALGVLNTARWDWSAANAGSCTTLNVGGCRDGQQKYVTMSWGYAGNNGKIGMFQVVQNRGNPDSATAIEDTVTTTGSPLDICTWTDAATGRANIAGVASNVNTKAWIATPGISQSGTALTGPNFFQATPTLALETSFSNTYNSANSIDCIDGVGAIGNSGGVWVTYMNGPNQGLTLAGPISIIPNARGVAITRDEGKFGRFVAISSSSTQAISIYNVSKTTPALVASLTPPAGTFKQMKWDISAQQLWVATGSNIAVYDVHGATTVVPIAEGIVVAANGTRSCVGADNLASTDCSGVSDQSRSGLNGCGGVSQPACTTATQTAAINIGTGAGAGVAVGTDIGSGIKAWAQSVGFVSDGSLFFFGLLLMAFGMVAGGAAAGAFGGKQAGAVTAGVIALGIMIFNMLQAIWGLWTMAIMIVLTAAVLSVIIRKLYQPGVESSGGV